MLTDENAPARLLVVLPTLTTQGAYNRGLVNQELSRSLYSGWDGKQYADSKRATAFSLRSPCEPSLCARWTFAPSISLIEFLESRGVPVVYTTDWAIADNHAMLLGYPAVTFNFHPEYIPVDAFQGAMNAAQAGIHFLIFMANEFYWRVEIDGKDGEPVMICDRGKRSNQWRCQTDELGLSLSEQRLFYSSYPEEGEAWGERWHPLVVAEGTGPEVPRDAFDLQHWIFQDTGFQ